MIEYIFLTISESEANNLIANAIGFGILIGILIGMFLGIFFLYLLNQTYFRNFKMWILSLPENQRQETYEALEQAHDIFDKLSKSNTRIFKKWFNDLCHLKTYLKLKWMYN